MPKTSRHTSKLMLVSSQSRSNPNGFPSLCLTVGDHAPTGFATGQTGDGYE